MASSPLPGGSNAKDPAMSTQSRADSTDDTFQVLLEATELPLGLLWECSANALPVVRGVTPGSPAESQPQIMPGHVLAAVNDHLVPPGATILDIEKIFQRYRYEGFLLSFAAPPNTMHPKLVHTQAPMNGYLIGECYRALAPLVVREAEDLTSVIVAEFEEDTVVEVMAMGVGGSGRRLKVQALCYSGWISCQASTGQILLDTVVAERSEPTLSARVAERCDPSLGGDSDYLLHEGYQSEGSVNIVGLTRASAVCTSMHIPEDGPPLEDSIAVDPKMRRRKLLEDSKFRQPKGKGGKNSDGRWSTRISQLIGAKHRGQAQRLIADAGVLYTSARDSMLDTFKPFSRRTRTMETDEDIESEDELDEVEMKNALGSVRKSNGKSVILGGVEYNYRTLALQRLELGPNMESTAEGKESKLRRCHRWTGWLRIKVKVTQKRIQVEHEGPPNPAAWALCHDLRFETFIGVLILCNGISIAVETFYKDDEPRPQYLELAEHIFTAMFMIEFFLRVMANSWLYFFSAMNLFDTYLVWSGVLVMWLLPVMGVDATVLRRFGALRILRLARLCRAVRLIPFFKELYMLVQGVMECTSLLAWTLVIGGAVLYTFSVAIVELITKDPKFEEDEETAEIVEVFFPNLAGCMLTLFQLMTFDGWAPIVRPIMEKDPKSVVLFMVYLGFAGIVLFNLMTAIVVRNAFDAAAADGEATAQYKAAESAKLRNELLEMFQDLDEDGSGALSEDEFKDCLDSYEFVQKMKLLDIELEDLPDIFEILDDGDGQVDQEEFCRGLENLAGPAMSGEMMKATSLMQKSSKDFRFLEEEYTQSSLDAFRNTKGRLDETQDGLIEITQLCAELVAAVDKIGIGKVVRHTTGLLPFIDDPEDEQIVEMSLKVRGEKTNESHAETEAIRRSRSARSVSVRSVRSSVSSLPVEPQEGDFTEKIIPPTWIIQNGKNPLAKFPGKRKLLKDPNLKKKLLGEKRVKQKKAVPWTQRRFGPQWHGLGLPISEEGKLETESTEEVPVPQLRCPATNYLPPMLAAEPRPPEPPELVPLPPEHPHVMPQDNEAPLPPEQAPSPPEQAPLPPDHPHAMPPEQEAPPTPQTGKEIS